LRSHTPGEFIILPVARRFLPPKVSGDPSSGGKEI